MTIQLDLMKTNFKLDSYTNASRNSLIKMIIDAFNNVTGIDASKSIYTYDSINKLVYGTRVVSIPDTIISSSTTLLLTTDEILGTGSINYYASKDNGATWLQIYKDILNDLSSLGSNTSLIVKAEFTGDAKLNAWAYGWN